MSDERDPRTEWMGDVRPDTDDATVVREVYEEDVYRLNQGLLREGDHVIDIGAHVGTFSIRAAAYGATVTSVEPNPRSATQLLHNAAQAGQLERITLMVCGVSALEGWPLVSVGDDGTAHTATDSLGFPSVSLETLITGPVRLLKVDCEGAEYGIFGGVPAGLLEQVEHIAMEWHQAPMLGGREVLGNVGELVQALLPTHHVEVFGQPTVGGFLAAVRYGLGEGTV